MSAGLRLGVLDQSPIISGHTPAEAVRETIALAVEAEKLGYSRYWLAEHHAITALADPCPEILVAAVAAATSFSSGSKRQFEDMPRRVLTPKPRLAVEAHHKTPRAVHTV